jgi:multidrug resistance efflux pump
MVSRALLARLLVLQQRSPLALLVVGASVIFSVAFLRVSWHGALNPREQRREIAATVFNGTIAPADEIAITSAEAGLVRGRFAKIGDHVTSGQALLALDDREARLALAQADLEEIAAARQFQQTRRSLAAFDEALTDGKEALTEATARVSVAQRQAEQVPGRQWRDSPERAQAARDQALQRWQRATTLRGQGLISDQDLEEATIAVRIAEDDLTNAHRFQAAGLTLEQAQERQAHLETELAAREQQRQRRDLEAQLEQARLRHVHAVAARDLAHRRLDDTSIRASGPGIVVALPVKVGEQVTPGVVLARLATLESLVAQIQVSSQLVNVLRPQQRVLVTLPTLPPQQVEGLVLAINPIPVVNLTHTVDVQFPNPTGVLLVGQPAEVRMSPELSPGIEQRWARPFS